MTGARVAAAAAVAVALTGAQLGAVAWMNHAEHQPEPPPSRAPLPILAPPKRQEPPPPEPTTTLNAPNLQAPAPKPLAVVEPSAVSDLPDTHAPTDHIAVLPGLEAGDLGPLSVGQIGEGSAQPNTPARPIRRPQPSYPPSARRRNIEGFVTVRLRVDRTGRVVDAVVVNAEPEGVFEDAAVRTARLYRFEPAIVDGDATADTVEQRIVFRLRR